MLTLDRPMLISMDSNVHSHQLNMDEICNINVWNPWKLKIQKINFIMMMMMMIMMMINLH